MRTSDQGPLRPHSRAGCGRRRHELHVIGALPPVRTQRSHTHTRGEEHGPSETTTTPPRRTPRDAASSAVTPKPRRRECDTKTRSALFHTQAASRCHPFAHHRHCLAVVRIARFAPVELRRGLHRSSPPAIGRRRAGGLCRRCAGPVRVICSAPACRPAAIGGSAPAEPGVRHGMRQECARSEKGVRQECDRGALSLR